MSAGIHGAKSAHVTDRMNEARARQILGAKIHEDDHLGDGYRMGWGPDDQGVTLEGTFTPDELEAMAWWMRNKAPKR